MQEIRGKRENSVRYVSEGYEYHIDTTSPHLFRCSTRSTTGCKGAAQVLAGNIVDVYEPHEGHDPNDTIIEEAEMRSEMLDLAVQTNNPLKQIFDDVCRRHPIVAPKLRYPVLKSAMTRARARVRPVIPGSLRELADALETYELTQGIYRGLVEAADGSIGLIFVSDQMKAAINECTEIYVDGTFKVAPSHPPIVQLYTVHLRVADTGIAAVYILCGSRTKALYSAIFQKIVELSPGIAANLRFVMGDYESGAMNAIREVFPEAQLHGCWFHFNQALARRWRRLGLTNAPRTVLGLAMALPLAPADRFAEGLELLAGMADRIAEDHPALLQFMLYLRRYWAPLAAVVSVYECPIRTNNLVESFHNEAKRRLGGLHPNIWKFVEHLVNMIVDQGIDYMRVDRGEIPRRLRTRQNMAADTYIQNAQHSLSVQRYTLLEFLERCAARTAGVSRILRQDNEVEEALPDDELVQPGLMAAGDPRVVEPVLRGGQRGRGVRRGVRGRGRRARDRAMVVAIPLLLDEEQPAPADPPGPELEPEPALAAMPEPLVLANPNVVVADDGVADEEIVWNEDDFHLPEDDFEQLPIPHIEVPFHPIIGNNGVRPAAEIGRPAGACSVCFDHPATHAYIPCGHQCCCENCATQHGLRCPLCREDSVGVYRIRANP